MNMPEQEMKYQVSSSFLFALVSFLSALAILWGNLVTSLGAGLACPDWPLCHSRFLPPLQWDVFLEFSHRLIALGLTGSSVALTGHIFRTCSFYFRKLILLFWALLILQIGLGGLTVLLKLPPPVTVTHLANSLLIFILSLFLTFLSLKRQESGKMRQPYKKLLVLVYIQALLGGLVRHTGAGLSCGLQFPLCLDQVFPKTMTFPLAAHLAHRIFAYFLALVFLKEAFFLAKREKQAGFLLFLLILLQIFLGAWAIFFQLQPWLVTLHLFNALLVIALLVFFGLTGEESIKESFKKMRIAET